MLVFTKGVWNPNLYTSLKIMRKLPSWKWESYCWWKKSCTAWQVWNPVNTGISSISTGEFAGCLNHQQYESRFLTNDFIKRKKMQRLEGWRKGEEVTKNTRIPFFNSELTSAIKKTWLFSVYVGYGGWNPTQLCRDYNKPMYINDVATDSTVVNLLKRTIWENMFGTFSFCIKQSQIQD